MDTGRPSKLTEEKIKTAIKLSQEGRTIAAICKFLEITKMTYYNWAEKYPEIKERINEERKKAKEREIEKVRKSLLKRATGYTYTETEEYVDRKGNVTGSKKKTKHMAGDVKAQLMYLANNDPENWKLNPDGTANTSLEDDSVQITIVEE